ncbi:MAG TPA: SsrA-binding protein SmpB [Actinomycetota bacterium]|nr:SsrA-binding protein SmpB [Actinomycetota bacterium]
MASGEKTVVQNRKAFHDYAIEDRFEAGVVLKGSEVKSLREGRVHIREAYASVRDGEAWISGMHINPYSSASTHETLDPVRTRKLLLRGEELLKIHQLTAEKGYTLVPLRVYFVHGLAKVELGLGRGKKSHDRRRDIAAREASREVDRALRRSGR